MTAAAALAMFMAEAASGPVLLAELTIRQQVIIRVPALPARPAAPISWKEKSGPKCISAQALGGAQITREGVDLLLRGGTRVRAKLRSGCQPLDFYSGFYIRPSQDGQICEDRDTIRVRSGGSCEIGKFKLLVPRRQK